MSGPTKLWALTIRPPDGDPYRLDVEADTSWEARERGQRENPQAVVDEPLFLALVEETEL